MNDKESTAGKEDNSSTLERLVERALANGASDPDSAESKAELVRVLLSERYSGAFPHPDVLRQFDDVIDNGAESIGAVVAYLHRFTRKNPQA